MAMPLIGREFRSASRQKRLYVMRVVMVLVLGIGLLQAAIMQMMLRRAGGGGGGSTVFVSQALIIFFFASIFVIAQSCGAISDERRRGTLGLLLLTPLRPWDVVLGKFVARCCEGFQICLVALPIIFVPFMMGGLSYGQVLAAFVLILAQMMLCASLTLCLSTWCRGAAAAFCGALVILGVIEIGAEILMQVGGFTFFSSFYNSSKPIIFMSPFSALVRQFTMGSGDFAWSFVTLAVAMLFSVGMLSLAALSLPRVLDEAVGRRRASGIRPLKPTARRVRCCANENAPIYWLEWGRKASPWRWGWLALPVGLFALIGYLPQVEWMMMMVMMGIGWVAWLMNMVMAVSVARGVQAQKQERILELMMATPIRDKEWVNQRLRSAWSAYGVPVLIMVFSGIACSLFFGSYGADPMRIQTVSLLVSLIGSLASWYMLAVIAIWVGLGAKSAGEAVGKLVLYYVVWHIASSMLATLFWIPMMVAGPFMGGIAGMGSMVIFTVLSSFAVVLGQVLVAAFLHRRLLTNLRDRIVQ